MPTMSAELDVRRTDEFSYPSIHKYLNQNVAAVKLPEKYKARGESKDQTYSPLILDGASGVGKTQQAFALLKGGQSLVYVLMSPRSELNQQKIYKDMRRFTQMDENLGIDEIDQEKKDIVDMLAAMILRSHVKKEQGKKDEKSFLDLLDMAMEQTKNEIPTGKDAYGMECIKDRFDAKRYIAKLKEFLFKRVITYSSQHEYLEIKDSVLPRKIPLQNVVLFIDEALPPPPTSGGKQDNADSIRDRDLVYNRLRFLRNFGRVCGMRTVLAGTAATAANINKWALPPAPSSSMPCTSRQERDNYVLWAEVEFLKPHIETEIQLVKQTDSAADDAQNNVSVHMRPLLKTWLQNYEPFDSIEQFIKDMGDKLSASKKFPDDSKMMWLSGAWLDSKQRSSSPFRLKSANLVRSHFFEPAISMDSTQHFVYLGQGIDDIKRRQGPVRLQVLKRPYGDEGVVWALVVLNDKRDGNEAAGVSTDFRDIEYVLLHCVQQCLAKEPPLAVVLSTKNHFKPDEFRKAIPVTFTETEAQLTKGALDGKLNELVMFAALQLACRKDDGFLSTNTVPDFIKKLHEYLHITVKKNRKKLLGYFEDDFKTHPGKDGESEITKDHKRHVLEGFNDGQNYVTGPYNPKEHENKLDGADLPWLVPACSHKELQEKYKKQPNLFPKGLNIAGLIPGTNNSFFDAQAYTWGDTLEQEWAFEFKCQAEYSLKDGCDHLVRKCHKKKEKDTVQCHAMLIGITGARNTKSCCQWWVEQGQYLRVVLVVNNSPY